MHLAVSATPGPALWLDKEIFVVTVFFFLKPCRDVSGGAFLFEMIDFIVNTWVFKFRWIKGFYLKGDSYYGYI